MNFGIETFLLYLKKHCGFIIGDELIDPLFVADFVCFDKIIVEIKAISETAPIHEAQVMNYLKVTEMQLGLLVNFGHHPKATVQRIVNTF